jgi:hypothetical protein
MIVHTRKPKRRTEAQPRAAPPPVASIVTASKPGRLRREREPIDRKAEVKAWFARNIGPPGAR